MRISHRNPVIRLVVTMAALAACAQAGDWAQWRGPNRDGKSSETGLLKAWPEGGPAELWSVTGLGDGFSTVSVSGDTVYTTGMVDGQGKLFFISTDGSVRRTLNYGAEVTDNYEGARSTPTVDDGRVYVMSGRGRLSCFSAADGETLWQVDTAAEYGGRPIQWHIAESVLIDGDNVICTPGGPKALLVALNKKTGKKVWACEDLDSKSAYCSPILVDHNGRPTILTMVEYGAVGVDAATGELLWKHAHKNRYAVHAATPIYHNGKVFITSGYGYGSECLEIAPDGKGVKVLWSSKDLDNHHGGVIRVGDCVYGTKMGGRQPWVCLDLESGRTKWTSAGAGKGAITHAEGLFYSYAENGTVSLVNAGPESCTIISSFQVTRGTKQHWSHPVVANGRLYIRHGDTLMCYDIAGK